MAKIFLIALVLLGIWLLLRKAARGQTKGPRIGEVEARAILGVDASADADAIRAAHRRLIGSVHPDRGGSSDLTGRINAARDVLLKRRD